jgi:hypothetical protein
MLFVNASNEGVGEVIGIYCQASRQRINLDKLSVFFNKGCQESTRTTMKNILNVKYLGMWSDVGFATSNCLT